MAHPRLTSGPRALRPARLPALRPPGPPASRPSGRPPNRVDAAAVLFQPPRCHIDAVGGGGVAVVALCAVAQGCPGQRPRPSRLAAAIVMFSASAKAFQPR
jgi:hypothetical protein